MSKHSGSSTFARTEIIGGITTFFTMAYIVVVNPAILASPGTGMSFPGVLSATVLLCFSMTLLMGLYARLPFAVAPGMGINAFFAFTIVIGQKVPWQQALGAVFWAGVLFLAISVTPVRVKVAEAIPQNLRVAASTGIGMFLSLIGLKNAGLVVGSRETLVRLGHIDGKAGLAIAGLAVIVILHQRKSSLAFLAGMAVSTLGALLLGYVAWPAKVLSAPDFSGGFLKMDPLGALRLSLVPAMISILFTDLFDSISTFVGVSHATGLSDQKGQPKNLKEGLVVDALATLFAGVFGTSSGTAYIESAAGIEAGGRTGWTSVVTALCFLPCFFLAPIAGMVPAYATAPVLIFVGGLMFRTVGEIRFSRFEEAFPAFLTIVLIPLTFSITQGILWGFACHVGLFFLVGRRRELSPMLIGIGVASVMLIAMENRYAS